MATDALAALSESSEIRTAAVDSYADLKSSDGKKYTVYNISVTDASEHGTREFLSHSHTHFPHSLIPFTAYFLLAVHVLQKRFNEFSEIYRVVKPLSPEIAGFSFPSKTLSFNKDQAQVKEGRREKFNEFVVVSAPTASTSLAICEAAAAAAVRVGNALINACGCALLCCVFSCLFPS